MYRALDGRLNNGRIACQRALLGFPEKTSNKFGLIRPYDEIGGFTDMTVGSSKAKAFLSDACDWEWVEILHSWAVTGPNFLSYSAADEIQPKLFYNQRLRLCSHNMPDRFSCRHEKLPGKVWTPIRYVTVHYKDIRSLAAALRYSRQNHRSCCVDRGPTRYGFRVGAKTVRRYPPPRKRKDTP